jgi:tyrosinase
MPLSANMALDDVLNMVFVREDVRFADLMRPVEGPFCYMYE